MDDAANWWKQGSALPRSVAESKGIRVSDHLTMTDAKHFHYGVVMDIDRMIDTPCDVDIRVTHNGQTKEFSYAEFFTRLGFKE